MQKVTCISVRPMMPAQIKLGKSYYMDENTKYTDNDGDNKKARYIGYLRLSHFLLA